MERRAFTWEYECKEDGGQSSIEGYGSVFGNVDSYGDIVMPGAFAKSTTEKAPAMLWQHNPTMPMGKWDMVREDAKGLYLKGRFADTQLGRDARELAKMGAISGLSIGYSTVDSESDSKTNTRLLKEIKLYEVSLVTFPANDKATITDVKNKVTTIREFEEFLRDAGYSRSEAKALASGGFKALDNQWDAGEIDAVSQTIQHAINILRS